MNDISGGQLWVSSEPRTYYVAKVHLGVAFMVPVRIEGTGKNAKVIGDGKVRSVRVSEVLDTWMPTGMPIQVPRTWHERLLLEDPDET